MVQYYPYIFPYFSAEEDEEEEVQESGVRREQRPTKPTSKWTATTEKAKTEIKRKKGPQQRLHEPDDEERDVTVNQFEALGDFQGIEPGDLSFRKGDIFTILAVRYL